MFDALSFAKREINMKYGFVIPGGDIPTVAKLAAEAEAAGWDGVFIPDCIAIETPSVPPGPTYDPWVMLAVMATRTERVRIGTMLTSPSRRRPWKLARETMSVDHVSSGRLILAVGLGAATDDGGFYKVGEAMDLKVRAQMLDESLEVLAGLWSGQPLTFHGEHYRVEGLTLLPSPVQSPRIPIWVVGAWPRLKSMQRALRWDGVIPQKSGTGGPMTPGDIRAMRVFIEEQRSQTAPFDIVIEGTTPGDDRAQAIAQLGPYAEAGVTWWLEAMWEAPGLESVRTRIRQGPPRIDA
jgi:Luciferase-like monooxygenase